MHNDVKITMTLKIDWDKLMDVMSADGYDFDKFDDINLSVDDYLSNCDCQELLELSDYCNTDVEY